MEVLQKLFSYTQTQRDKVFGTWLLIPGTLAMASKEMWDLP